MLHSPSFNISYFQSSSNTLSKFEEEEGIKFVRYIPKNGGNTSEGEDAASESKVAENQTSTVETNDISPKDGSRV
jgi:hypothetical protein